MKRPVWLEQAKATVVGEEVGGVAEDQITWGLAGNSKDLGLHSKRNCEPVQGVRQRNDQIYIFKGSSGRWV